MPARRTPPHAASRIAVSEVNGACHWAARHTHGRTQAARGRCTQAARSRCALAVGGRMLVVALAAGRIQAAVAAAGAAGRCSYPG